MPVSSAPTLQKTVAPGAHAFVTAPQPPPSFTPMPGTKPQRLLDLVLAYPDEIVKPMPQPMLVDDTWRTPAPTMSSTQPFFQQPVMPVVSMPPSVSLPNAIPMMNLPMPPPLGMPQPGMLPPTMMPAGIVPGARPAVITHDTVKLEGIPANNRIFVEGKAHEVCTWF